MRVAGSAEVLSALDIPEEDNADLIARRILRRSEWDNLASGERRINIYFLPSRRARNMIVNEEVLQIDCHFPAMEDYLAYRVQTVIKSLIHKYSTGAREYYFGWQLGELSTMKGFVCVGSRYYFYVTI